jgi:phage host-nuclease inhibitor protein Gam
MSAVEKTTIELPAKAKDWTNDHLDEALRRTCDHERALGVAKAKYDADLMRIKEKFETAKKDQASSIKTLVKSMRDAAKRLRDEWKNKSITLPWGTLAFRKNPPCLELADGASVESAVAYLEAHGHGDCVRRDPVLNKEVLERKPPAVIEAAGYRWSEPNETFEYKTKLTIDAETAAQMKAGA